MPSWPRRVPCRWLAAYGVAALLRSCGAATHYEQPPCQYDEVQGEVQGASGYLCAPKCDESSYNCAVDTPSGSSAQPQCMLQDVDRIAYCGLLCQVDAQCPSGARCKNIKQVEVGLCMYPVSFADWAKQGAVSKKLAIGWPGAKPGASTASFQIAKTYSALQNLKQKYSIDDGDADMLVLKELLSSLKSTSPGAAAAAPPTALAATAATQPASAGAPAHQQQQPNHGTVRGLNWGAWNSDLSRMEGNMARGLPGLEEEIEHELWDVEHFTKYGACTELLRSLIILAIIYLAIGSAVKYYTAGQTGVNMLPHIGFWLDYPQLVLDGVQHSKILLGSSGASAGMPSADSRSGGVPRGGSGSFESL